MSREEDDNIFNDSTKNELSIEIIPSTINLVDFYYKIRREP